MRFLRDQLRGFRAVAVCLIIVGLTAAYAIGDRIALGAWISVIPALVWGALLLPPVVFLRRWLLGTLLVGFLLVTTEWPHFGGTDFQAEDAIRLVSWNIGAGNRSWIDSLEAIAPDIVLVQESLKPMVVWDGFEWYGTLDPGILTRYSAEVLPTEKVGPWIEPQLVLVPIRNKKLLVVNVRLMLPSVAIQLLAPFAERPVVNYRVRVGQYEKLAELVKKTANQTQADAIIVAGDFNIPARLPSLAPLRDFLNDAWLAAGRGWGPTVPAVLPLSRVDQVWVSDTVKLLSVQVRKFTSSDHRGVIVDFTL